MPGVRRHPVPVEALHAKYARHGGHADCYVTEIARDVTHSEFVEAFYTSWLFRLERFVLAWLVNKPSTDAEARALARGERERFAAWTLESRAPNELLMQDYQDKTRSWFKVEPTSGPPPGTRLCFGTAIAPVTDRRTGAKRLGVFFSVLMGFHLVYSRALLAAARWRLARSPG
jgi:hypothetical protein